MNFKVLIFEDLIFVFYVLKKCLKFIKNSWKLKIEKC